MPELETHIKCPRCKKEHLIGWLKNGDGTSSSFRIYICGKNIYVCGIGDTELPIEEKDYRSGYYGSKDYGIWWFRIFGYGLYLYAPWKYQGSSERYGYRKVLKFKGWRIGVLRP